MKVRVLIYLILFELIPAWGDDLLNGYATLLSSRPNVEVSVKPSIERGEIKDKYNYLVFVFMNGVNDLGILNFSISDINEMELVGSSDKVAVVVEHNRIEKTRQGLRFGVGANTYFIRKDPNNSPEIVSDIISYTPDGDMGSAKHFAISAKKVIKRFNPDKLVLIVWNHGNGYFGIAYDDVSGNSMSIKDLGSALSDIKKAYGRKIDIFAMDACLMQMAEVASELRDYANFIVASEELVPGAGYPYDDVIANINSAGSVKDAAIGIVDAFYNAYSSGKSSIFGRYFDKNITLSVVDTSKYNQFVSLLNNWVRAALRSSDFKIITSSSIKDNVFFFLNGITSETINLGPYLSTESEGVMTRSADVVDYLELAYSNMKDEGLKKETKKLSDFIKTKLVVYHKAGDIQNSKGLSYKDRTHGLAIYLPKLRYNSSKYEGLRFVSESMWDDFLRGELSDELAEYGDNRQTNDSEAKGLSEEVPQTANQKKDTTNLKVEADSSLMNAFSEDTYSRVNTSSIDGSSVRTRPEIANQTNFSNDFTKRSPSYSNIYSTSYANKKTLTPQEDSLVDVVKSVSGNRAASSPSTDKKTVTSSSNISVSSVIDRSKKTIGIMLAQVADGAKKMKEMIIEDKDKKREIIKLMEKFEVEISTNLNVEFAKKLSQESSLQQEFLKIDRNRASKLISYALSIKELDEMLLRDYSDDANILSSYLSTTLDRSRQICELNICVPPENLVEKMIKKNSERYPQSKVSFTERAIRKWEYVFSDESIVFDWAQARNVRVSSSTWLDMSVKERNAAIDHIVKDLILMGNTTQTPINLTPDKLKKVEKREELSNAVIRVSSNLVTKGFLSSEEFNAISKKPLEEQAYILANLFDRSGIKNNPEFTKDVAIINANRTSFTTEVLDGRNRAILSNYLSNNIKSELSKSKTASKLYSDLYGNSVPSISLEYIVGKESNTNGKQIIINASLVEQYMRMKGYTVESLKDENVRKEIAAYISPLVVKEMGLAYVSSKNKDYSPEVREKYGVALLYQAQYLSENQNLNNIFSGLYGYSDYVDKLAAVSRLYRTSDSKYDFIQSAGLRYYPNLLSASTAKSEMLNAVTREIERRSKLSIDERKNIDKYAIFSENDIDRLTPSEIAAHVNSFTTQALLKIQQRLINRDNFASIYSKIISSI